MHVLVLAYARAAISLCTCCYQPMRVGMRVSTYAYDAASYACEGISLRACAITLGMRLLRAYHTSLCAPMSMRLPAYARAMRSPVLTATSNSNTRLAGVGRREGGAQGACRSRGGVTLPYPPTPSLRPVQYWRGLGWAMLVPGGRQAPRRGLQAERIARYHPTPMPSNHIA
eukprot:2133982-Rhodomonas_salina.1